MKKREGLKKILNYTWILGRSWQSAPYSAPKLLHLFSEIF